MGFSFITNRQGSPSHTAGRMAAARRKGTGAYLADWACQGAPTVDAIVEPLLDWCRSTLGNTRRPHGIDAFDLVIAYRGGDDPPRSLSLQHIAPAELYGTEGLVGSLRRFLELRGCGAVGHISVALFSWGDAAYAALASEPSPS